MKKLRKYSTFDELKSQDLNTINSNVSLKKHKAFENFIMEIKQLTITKEKNQNNGKPF